MCGGLGNTHPQQKCAGSELPLCDRPGQGDFLVKNLGNPASSTNLCILTKKCPILIFNSGRAGLFPKVLSLHKFVDTNLLLKNGFLMRAGAKDLYLLESQHKFVDAQFC